jgi:hypothetical protein
MPLHPDPGDLVHHETLNCVCPDLANHQHTAASAGANSQSLLPALDDLPDNVVERSGDLPPRIVTLQAS